MKKNEFIFFNGLELSFFSLEKTSSVLLVFYLVSVTEKRKCPRSKEVWIFWIGFATSRNLPKAYSVGMYGSSWYEIFKDLVRYSRKNFKKIRLRNLSVEGSNNILIFSYLIAYEGLLRLLDHLELSPPSIGRELITALPNVRIFSQKRKNI